MSASRLSNLNHQSDPQPEATLRLKHEHDPMELEFHAADEERLEYLKTQVDMLVHPAAFLMIRQCLEQDTPLDEALLSQVADVSRVCIEERRIVQMTDSGPCLTRAILLKKPSPSSSQLNDEADSDTLDFALHLVKEPGMTVRAHLTWANETMPTYTLNTLLNRWKCVDELVLRLGYKPMGWDISENARNKDDYAENDLFDFEGFTLMAPRASSETFERYDPPSERRKEEKSEPWFPIDGEDPHSIYDEEEEQDSSELGDSDISDAQLNEITQVQTSGPQESLDPQPCEPLTILRPATKQVASICRLSKWNVSEAVIEKVLSLATTRQLLNTDLDLDSKLLENIQIAQSRIFQMRGWLERTQKISICPAYGSASSSIGVEFSPYMEESPLSLSFLKARVSWEEFDYQTHVKNWSKIVQAARGQNR